MQRELTVNISEVLTFSNLWALITNQYIALDFRVVITLSLSQYFFSGTLKLADYANLSWESLSSEDRGRIPLDYARQKQFQRDLLNRTTKYIETGNLEPDIVNALLNVLLGSVLDLDDSHNRSLINNTLLGLKPEVQRLALALLRNPDCVTEAKSLLTRLFSIDLKTSNIEHLKWVEMLVDQVHTALTASDAKKQPVVKQPDWDIPF
jgi:hypothetical protein